MPLTRSEEGAIRWAPTSPTEYSTFIQSLTKENENGALPLTYELKTKLDQALKTLAPRGGVDAMADANRRLYSSLKQVLGAAPGVVDIILPVHNAIHITRKCIDRVLSRTNWPFHLYIMDDASDAFTKTVLAEYAANHPDKITLVTNAKNKGFAATVNRGIRAGKGEYVCLLNSDVFVTDLWLSKMILALQADQKNQIVCPATNNTAVVEVPLSPGASYLQMNSILESFAHRRYPELLPTGFCYLFRRKLLSKVGYFDEGYQNFGEETDHWWKVTRFAEGSDYKRWRAVMADDCYVFHERGASYSQLGQDTHMHLRKLASSRFGKLWPEFASWRQSYDVNKAVGGLRERIPSTLLRSPRDRYRVCWVVYDATFCGGMKYIADIVNELNEQGVNAKIAVIKRKPENPEMYLGELTCAPVFFNSPEDFVQDFPARIFPSGLVIAATSELAPIVQSISEFSAGRIRAAVHSQSYEPDMVEEKSKSLVESCFKSVPDIISSSAWVTKRLEQDLNLKPFATIHPGVDRYLFYKRDRTAGDDRMTVMLSMAPAYPCKGFDRGLELILNLEAQAKARGMEIRILVYGVESLPIVSQAVCLGALTQTRIAMLLGTEVDVFVDPSHLHSYGMPALEALACGAKVFSWDNRGVREYGEKLPVTILPNDASAESMATNILNFLEKPNALAEYLSEHYAQISSHIEKYHDRDKSVRTFIKCIEKHFNLQFVSRRICMIVPHLRKHGGPTTMLAWANELQAAGHSVRIASVYPDVNPEVVATTNLPVSVSTQKLDACDLIIINSDNPLVEQASKQTCKKIMLKLSHNPRFQKEEEKGLNQVWDAVVTSSEWLRAVSETVTEGWTYRPQHAIRVGWWNYGFAQFQCHPSARSYGDGKTQPIVISTLVHAHPTKGTREALEAMAQIALRYGAAVRFIGVGEVPPSVFRSGLPNFEYRCNQNRVQMAETMKQTDIWVGASFSEGLGRMGLEAMSAGAAVISTNTGAEYMRSQENCLLIDESDPKLLPRAIAKAIEQLIENPVVAMSLRERGFDTAAALADPTHAVAEMQKVIQNVFS